MLRFFRQIRQKLIEQENMRKYVWYALGEIFLVVIGILIALQVNNWNEERKNRQQVLATFQEIQNDLYTDILEVDRYINYNIILDSLIQKVFSDTLTIEDYQSDNSFQLTVLMPTENTFLLHENGYKKLTTLSSKDHYASITNSLQDLYVNIQNSIISFQSNSNELANEYRAYLRKNYNWYATHLSIVETSTEQIEFYLHDPIYKNYLKDYNNDIINSQIPMRSFRHRAILAYKEIHALLKEHGYDNEMPEFISEFYKPITEVIQERAGVYYSQEFDQRMVLDYEDGELIITEGVVNHGDPSLDGNGTLYAYGSNDWYYASPLIDLTFPNDSTLISGMFKSWEVTYVKTEN